jgi:hypothetical protein
MTEKLFLVWFRNKGVPAILRAVPVLALSEESASAYADEYIRRYEKSSTGWDWAFVEMGPRQAVAEAIHEAARRS